MPLRAKTAPIGTAPLVLCRERRAQATEAGDHLVEDQQDAVLRGDFAQTLQVTDRRNQHAGGACDRLDDDRGHRRRIMQRQDALQVVGQMSAPLRLPFGESIVGEVVGMRQVIDTGEHGPEMLAIARDAADRDTAEADAVIAALAADQAGALPLAAHAVIGQCNLERGIDGL
jgi:hypothetical protein